MIEANCTTSTTTSSPLQKGTLPGYHCTMERQVESEQLNTTNALDNSCQLEDLLIIEEIDGLQDFELIELPLNSPPSPTNNWEEELRIEEEANTNIEDMDIEIIPAPPPSPISPPSPSFLPTAPAAANMITNGVKSSVPGEDGKCNTCPEYTQCEYYSKQKDLNRSRSLTPTRRQKGKGQKALYDLFVNSTIKQKDYSQSEGAKYDLIIEEDSDTAELRRLIAQVKTTPRKPQEEDLFQENKENVDPRYRDSRNPKKFHSLHSSTVGNVVGKEQNQSTQTPKKEFKMTMPQEEVLLEPLYYRVTILHGLMEEMRQTQRNMNEKLISITRGNIQPPRRKQVVTNLHQMAIENSRDKKHYPPREETSQRHSRSQSKGRKTNESRPVYKEKKNPRHYK